jgi:hypothetical protein
MCEEELFEIGMARFKRLATFLRQGVEGGFENVAHVKIGSVVTEVSTLHI